MNDKRYVDELRDALENLARNPEGLPLDELQARIRQISKQAIADGDAAERGGEFEKAIALYELAARAFRRLADLASGDLRASELATAEFWLARAELAATRRDRAAAAEEAAPQPPGPRAIHTPKPIPLSPRTSIRREQTGRLSSPAAGDSRKAERFERIQRKRPGDPEGPAYEDGSFRKPEDR